MSDPWGVVTVNAPVRSGSARWTQYHHDHVRPNATVVCCQESPNRQDEFANAYDTKHTGWKLLPGEPVKDPIGVDTSVWKILNVYSRRFSSVIKVNDSGQGNKIQAQYIHYVDLEHRAENQKVRISNNHFPASVYLGGVRDAISEKAARNVADMVTHTAGAVIICGDFNQTWDDSNLKPIRDSGLIKANPPGATLADGRQVDLVAYRSAKNLKPKLIHVDGKVLPTVITGDHSGVAVNFRFKGASEPKDPKDPETPKKDCACGEC